MPRGVYVHKMNQGFQNGNKLGKANLGKKASNEAKKKMSLARKGYKHSEETKRKLSEANKGKPCLSCHLKTNFNREHWIKYFND